MNIELSGIKNHFFTKKTFYNKEQEEESNIKKKKNWTKIVNYCFYSINEANICNKIKKIPYYSNYYSILEDYDFINISTIHDKMVEKVQLLDENKKYLLFTYKNHYTPFSQDLVNFDDFLFESINPKMLILRTITSFSYLLESLLQLEEQNICFFQLSPKNIIFVPDLREKPILHNFKLSLQISKLNEEYITNIIQRTKDYSLKPLEVHVLFYLIQNDIKTISYSFIEEIVEVFMKNQPILSFFSQSYRENYQKSCILSLKNYINKPKTEIILDILLNYNETWDVYSISVLYLHIFASISKVFSLKQTFISKITLELAKNIHPDPCKRGTLDGLRESCNKLFNLEKDWSFVNSLDVTKMEQLWDILKQ